MAEFEEKLNSILSDPEAMGQIVSIAQALTSGTGENRDGQPEAGSPAQDAPVQDASPPAPQTEPVPQPGDASQSAQPNWSAIMGLLGGLSGGTAAASPLGALGDLDPRLIQTAVRLFSEYSATDDRKIALLSALKPFLKPERYAKVDKAVQIAKLSRVIRVAFQLFKKDGEGDAEHV